jgi:hypothetical protein
MDLCTEFRNHERECRRMAAQTKDPRTKAIWKEMAERWAMAAENQACAEKTARALRHRREEHKPRRYGWLDEALAP